MHILIKTYGYLTYLLKYLRRFFKEMRALAAGETFYCTSLQGEADYGIAINSDLTVSCNCSDLYGFGKLGDLRKQNINKILSNEKSNRFRAELAKGKLPIIDCVACQNLHRSKKEFDTTEHKIPTSVLLENTVNCNLNCLSCRRERILTNRTKKCMTLDDLELISLQFKNLGVDKVYYFNQGEPFISNNIKEEIQCIKRHNPDIHLIVSTNGQLLDSRDKQAAALLFDHIFFSIHGSDQESISKYQIGADFQRAYDNMKALIKLRGSSKTPIIEWKYVLFRWNDKKSLLDKATVLAKEAEIDILSFWKTTFPAYGIYYKCFFGLKYFQNYGVRSWKGREIDFRIESEFPVDRILSPDIP